MRLSIVRATVVVGVLAVGASVASRGAAAPAPSVVAVSQLDIGYRLGAGVLKIRTTLATGEAIEYTTSEAHDVQTILAVAQACGGTSALSAVVEASALRALQCSIDRTFRIAR
jgi:hypothetical protein